MAPDADTYENLFERVREYNETRDAGALAVPHHPAEATFPFDFSAIDYDDAVAPLVEVYSQWGSSERPGRAGNRHPVLMGQGEADEPGHYVQDALALGNRVGLMASADFHGPRPGHSLLHTEPHLPPLSEWIPGGLGGVEFALVGMLAGLTGIDLALTGAVVVLYRLCSFWFVVAVGGLAAAAGTVSIGDLVTEVGDH